MYSGKLEFMNKLILFVLTLLFSQHLFAQQLPLFSQYRENYIAINPAMVSTEYLLYQQNLSFGASYRTQWKDFEGAPETQFLRGEYLHETRGFSLLTGGYLINDQTGPTGLTGVYGRIGGILAEDPYYGGISIGLSLGAVQYRVNTNELRLRDGNDILASDSKTQFYPDVGVGIYYYKQFSGGFFDDDYVYAGVSIPQAIGLNLEFQDESGDFSVMRTRHFYAQAGFFHILDGESYIELSSWAKFVEGAPVNVNINLRYQTDSNIWVGVGGSTAGTAHIETGVQLGENAGFDNTVRIGYSFDYTFSSFGPSVGNTHEFSIAYSLFTD